MPLSRETVHNKALNGRELKKILLQDSEKLFAANGLLNDYLGYGRIGYEIRLTLHLDNFSRTIDVTVMPSRAPSKNEVAERPELAAIETSPLVDPSADAVVDGTRLTRSITSPNAERVRAGLGVPIRRKQQDGSTVDEIVQYPPDPTFGEGNVGVEDVTPQVTRELEQRSAELAAKAAVK